MSLKSISIGVALAIAAGAALITPPLSTMFFAPLGFSWGVLFPETVWWGAGAAEVANALGAYLRYVVSWQPQTLEEKKAHWSGSFE
jgi:hypothetical protein